MLASLVDQFGRFPVLLRVVLYRQRLEDSVTYHSLVHSTRDWSKKIALPLAIWDNSFNAVRPQVDSVLELIDWKHQPANTGLVEAYNDAVEIAKRDSYPWILLLDQDTKVTQEYLISAVETALAAEPEVVAVAPKILVNGIQRSPNGHLFGCPVGFKICKAPGVSESLIYAINSGMLVRTAFIDEIGGYSTDYRLDAVDHWFCREVYRHGKKIAVLPFEFEHGLSVYDKENFVSVDRFAGIMESQTTFAISSKGWLPKMLYGLMLLAHAMSQAIRRPGRPYAKMAIQEWFRFCKKWIANR